MIAINNRKRIERIHKWTPELLTLEEQTHFYMFNINTTYKDDLLTEKGEDNQDISIIKELAGCHKDSTKLIL